MGAALCVNIMRISLLFIYSVKGHANWPTHRSISQVTQQDYFQSRHRETIQQLTTGVQFLEAPWERSQIKHACRIPISWLQTLKYWYRKYITTMHLTDDSFAFMGPSKKLSLYCHNLQLQGCHWILKNPISLLSSHTISVCDGLKVWGDQAGVTKWSFACIAVEINTWRQVDLCL